MRLPLTIILTCALMSARPLATGESSSPQASGPPRQGKGRVVGLIIGAGAGFALGLLAGFAWFDDAVDSDRKVWTTAVLLAAAGGTAGWLVGRDAAPDLDLGPRLEPADKRLRTMEFRFARSLQSMRLADRPFRSRLAARGSTGEDTTGGSTLSSR